MQGEPLSGTDVKRLLLVCLGPGGVVFFGSHALLEMANDQITTDDVRGILRGGVFDGCDLILGTWRYRMRKAKVYAVVAFDAENSCAIVTAWRKHDQAKVSRVRRR